MRRRVFFRPEAEAEALEARAWYEARRTGLGAEFYEALSQAIERISERPHAYQRVYGDARRIVLQRFPYAIYFRLRENEIVVLAVHGRQHPRRWQSRT